MSGKTVGPIVAWHLGAAVSKFPELANPLVAEHLWFNSPKDTMRWLGASISFSARKPYLARM